MSLEILVRLMTKLKRNCKTAQINVLKEKQRCIVLQRFQTQFVYMDSSGGPVFL